MENRGALAKLSRDKLKADRQTFISALILQGKVTKGYYSELFTDQFEYVLMEKNLN